MRLIRRSRISLIEELIMSDPASRQARRRFLRIAVVGAAAAPVAAVLLPRIAHADGVPLTSEDPTAKALAYTEDASTAKGNPAYKDGAACHTCNFFQGQGDAARAPCTLFPGKTVNAKGWCVSWAKRP
jgi:hypothetical protein